MKPVPASRYVLFAVIVAAGCALDLATKSFVFARLGFPPQPTQWLVEGLFGFTTSLNEGALFGFGQGQGLIFSGLSVIALLAIVYWLFMAAAAHDLALTISLASVSGGVLGNLYDRLGMPGLAWPDGKPVFAVRDWMHLMIGPFNWPIFNIADCLLVCGAALLVWHAMRTEQTPASLAATCGGKPH